MGPPSWVKSREFGERELKRRETGRKAVSTAKPWQASRKSD